MRKILFFLAIWCLAIFYTFANSIQKEKRTVIFTPNKNEKVYLLQPGGNITQNVSFPEVNYPTRKFLRVVGGVKMPVPFSERGENIFRYSEYYIDDNLDSIHVKNDKYSLYFKGENNNFERHAYYRISGELLTAGELTVTLPIIKQQNLSIAPDGNFGIEIKLFYKKPGRYKDDIYDQPDSLLYLSIPEGNSSYQNITQPFQLPDNIACALLRIGGTHFTGECWVEAPRLIQNKKIIKSIPFTKFAEKKDNHNYWVGCNLSTRSWPRWRLDYNGSTIFEGNIFDRASNIADFYIPLPVAVKGKGDLRLTLLKEGNRVAYPYELRSLEIIEESARDYEIVSVPKYIPNQNKFGILLETNKPNVKLKIEAPIAITPSSQEITFEKTGLHAVEFRAEKYAHAVPLIFHDGSRQTKVVIDQIVQKGSDEVFLSCGDDMYIDKQPTMYDYYFKWYLSNRIGNWFQFRPSYQWSGFRIVDPEFIRHYTSLLNKLQMPYAWQVEGRTLAGKQINPDSEILASPMFRGKQAHENDGGYYYWQYFPHEGLFSDLAARNRPYGGIFAKHRPIFTDHGTFVHYDPSGIKDMADGARTFVENLRYSKGESSRHTGPSTLFRYFYQAGYDWLGAEQMYGPEEIILSSLRGASRAYNKSGYGSLHAMQWGSHPYTDPKHSLRFYMSLAIAYMHGSSHINTEDALWTDEYANDRYSTSGKEHLYVQHRMFDFIETHTRRGELKSNIAIIQGRNDAWKSFGRTSLWSQKGDKWAFNKACESFDLLNIFYPDNIIDSYNPKGWFTSTPYGTVDLLPVEAPLDIMNQYKALVFLGWNSFDENDFLRIRNYVHNGGTLVLTAAHLNTELQPDQPVKFPINDSVIREMLGDRYKTLDSKTEISFGSGKIIYFPMKIYPAEKSLREQYETTLRTIAESTVSHELKDGWIESAPFIGFTVWDHKDHRTIYLLNTDWQNNIQQHKATFHYNGKKFPIDVRRYHIETLHCSKGLAVLPGSNTTDILSIDKEKGGWTITVQNTEEDTIRCFNSTTGTVETVHLTMPSIHKITIK